MADAAPTTTPPTTVPATTTIAPPPPACIGLCISNSNDPNSKEFCGVDRASSAVVKDCADGIRVVVRCPPASSSCVLPNGDSVLGQPVPFKSESFDPSVVDGTSPAFCRSSLPAVFLCPASRPSNGPVDKLNVSSVTTSAPDPSPETSVFAPSITTSPPATADASSSGPLIGGVAGGLVVIALLAFLFVQRSRRSRQHRQLAGDDVDEVPYTISQTPKALPLLANSAINNAPPAAFARVRSISDDFPVLDASVPTSTTSSIPPGPPSSDARSSRRSLPDRLRASRPDLADLWMPSLDQVKPNPLKGGDHDLKVVTIQGKKVVVRVLPNAADAASATRHAFFDAIQFIRHIMHPHITSVLGVGCLQHHVDVAVATEFMDQGSLGAYLLQLKQQHPSASPPLRLALHIGRALDYLHSTHDLAFGGLHPDKVLVFRESAADDEVVVVGAKLSVFHLMAHGCSTYQPKRVCTNTSGLANHVPFLAPERRRCADAAPTKPSDVYALAVVVGMIWTTAAPHAALYHDQGLVRGDVFLYNHPETLPYDDLRGMPPALAELLRQCWQVDPAGRPTVATLVAALEQVTH